MYKYVLGYTHYQEYITKFFVVVFAFKGQSRDSESIVITVTA